MGFNYIFWGLLFLLISFRVQGIDILPDFIGYILFIVGFTHLQDYNHHFSISKNLSIALFFLSLFNVYEPETTSSGFGLLSIINLAYSILSIVLIYQLCKGISAIALDHDDTQLANTAMLRWRLYIWGAIATFLIFFLVFVSPIIATILLIASSIYMIVIYCLLMGLTKQASRIVD
jgi:hypothetical protein